RLESAASLSAHRMRLAVAVETISRNDFAARKRERFDAARPDHRNDAHGARALIVSRGVRVDPPTPEPRVPAGVAHAAQRLRTRAGWCGEQARARGENDGSDLTRHCTRPAWPSLMHTTRRGRAPVKSTVPRVD